VSEWCVGRVGAALGGPQGLVSAPRSISTPTLYASRHASSGLSTCTSALRASPPRHGPPTTSTAAASTAASVSPPAPSSDRTVTSSAPTPWPRSTWPTPTVGYARAERLHAIMAEGGLTECGNAQNCIEVCPKQIPLTTAIGELGRAVTVQAIKDLFGGYEAIWLPPEAREPDETPARLRGGTLQVQGLPSSSEPAPWVPVEAGCRARGL
jgi:hypothetical protein